MSRFTQLLHIILAAMILIAVLPLSLTVAAADPGQGYWAPLETPGLDGYVIYSGSNVTAFAECPATGRLYLVDRGKSTLKTSADAAPAGQVGYWLFNTATNSALAGYAPATVTTAAAANDLGAAAAVSRLDLAPVPDFEPLNNPTVYISVGSRIPVATDDVYRLDGVTAVDLDAVNLPGATAFNGVDAIAYGGSGDSGTLFCGYIKADNAKVKRSTDADTAASVWVESLTPPTGSAGILLAAAADFATTGRLYAGTRGNDSAWNVSVDGGISFRQTAWIDNGITSDWIHIESLAISVDGAQFWCVTDDGADLNVWRGTVPPTGTNLHRVDLIYRAGDGNTSAAEVHLNPDWAASPTVYVLDQTTVPVTLYLSNDGGAT